MDGDDLADHALEEHHELVGTGNDTAARRRRVDPHVVGEHCAHAAPVLRVHRAEVPRLQLLDGFDVVHFVTVSGWHIRVPAERPARPYGSCVAIAYRAVKSLGCTIAVWDGDL